MIEFVRETTEVRRSRRGKTLDVAGWVLFFIWIGIVVFVRAIPDGVGSLGVGVIVFLGTAARIALRVSVSFFWIVIGLLFLGAGAGELAGIDLPLLPIVLIVCGVLLFLHQRSGRRGGSI